MKPRDAPNRELISWLVMVLRGHELRDLPLYLDDGFGPPRAAEEVARDLVEELRSVNANEPIGRVEGRAYRFRAWVETRPGWGAHVPVAPERRPEDPTGRGLNIARSLRLISKSAAQTGWPQEELPPAASPEVEARGSLYVLIALFVVPFVAGATLVLAKSAPRYVGWGLAALASFALLALLARVVPRSAIASPEKPRSSGPSGTNP